MEARVMDGYKLKAIVREANRAVRPMVERARGNVLGENNGFANNS